MSLLEQKANDVVGELTKNDLVSSAFDPTAIIGIITQIIQLFQGCGLSPQKAEQRAASPGLLGRLKLRRLVNGTVSDPDDREALFAALIEQGEKLNSSEVATLFNEV